MKLGLRIICTILLTSILASAASTKFVSTWRNPVGGSLDQAGKRVATFVLSADETMRQGPEETLAAELRRRGIDCLAGYTVLPGELAKDLEKAKAFVKKSGVTGAILMRVVGKEEQTRYTPDTVWYSAPHYSSFWGYWNYGWSAVYTPGYLTSETIVSVETMVYSVEKDMLLWAGKSETTNPKDVRKFVKDLVDAAGKEMRKAGLVRK
jgi:hypothetical protein